MSLGTLFFLIVVGCAFVFFFGPLTGGDIEYKKPDGRPKDTADYIEKVLVRLLRTLGCKQKIELTKLDDFLYIGVDGRSVKISTNCPFEFPSSVKCPSTDAAIVWMQRSMASTFPELKITQEGNIITVIENEDNTIDFVLPLVPVK